MVKSTKELAKELNLHFSTLDRYFCRPEFNFLELHRGKIYNWEMDYKFKIINILKRFYVL